MTETPAINDSVQDNKLTGHINASQSAVGGH